MVGGVSCLLALVVPVLALVAIVPPLAGPKGERNGFEVMSVDGGAVGPESLAFDERGGGPYTGVSDGRILQWLGPGKGWRQFALSAPSVNRDSCRGSNHKSREHICGRPLGLQFHHKTGDLYVADAYLGLLAVTAAGNQTRTVATAAHGIPFRFTNSIDIDQQSGIVYFTDTSAQFRRRDFIVALVTGDNSGRLMSYDPETKELKVLASGLSFANGVALSEDGSFLVVVETLSCRLLRYWLKTPGAGEIEVLAELPGFPDNVKRSPRGGFWVAMYTQRSEALRMVVPLPWLGRLLRRAPVDLEKMVAVAFRWRAAAMAVRVGEDGEILERLVGKKEWGIRYISEVMERNGSLWIGSVVMPHLGVLRL